MAGALTFLLSGCLLQGVLCGSWRANIQSTIEVIKGSCVTIPCSFDIDSSHDNNLNATCKAVWKKTSNEVVFNSSEKNHNKGELKGKLTDKDCTTTLNVVSERSSSYYFRLECNNALKWNFDKNLIWISVKDDSGQVTLTPSTLKVNEGTSVRLTCSAPAPCLPHPPTLTWTPKLGDSQETLQENQDKTKVQTSVLTFTASQLHHGRNISCTAVYRKLDGRISTTLERSLTPDVLYSPLNTTVSVSPPGPVPETSTVTLTCSSDANPPVKNYTWYRADGDQETLIGNGHLINIQSSKIRQPFFCKAENVLGVRHSNLTHIDVQYSPKNTTVSVSPSGPVPETSTVTLTCSSDANPPVKIYTWYRIDGDQETLIGTGSVINITATHVRQPFFCKVENDLAVVNSPKHCIDLQYKPRETTVSVSPSGPVPETSTVTLTCSSDANPPVKNYTCYRADGDQETLIGNGPVLNITASKANSIYFCKAENEQGVGCSDRRKIDVQFPPQILPSSICTKTQSHVNCSCETEGNPSPTLHWYLDGLPVNQSSKYTVITESLSNTSLRSIITVSQPQENLPTLSCHSSNSLGSASKHFWINCLQTSAETGEKIPLPVFITTIVAALALVSILLFVIRFQRDQYKSQLTGGGNTFASDQHLGEGKEDTAGGDIYENTTMLKHDVAPPAPVSELNSSSLQKPGPDDAEEPAGSSGTNEDGNDVLYSSVIWKSKGEKKSRTDSVLYLEEEKCEAGLCRNFVSNALEMETLYAEVKPRNIRKRVESVNA